MTTGVGNFWAKTASAVATVLAISVSAQAGSTPPEQAVEMLARAQSLNARCNYFSAENRSHLAALVQRAEQALTERENAAAAMAALNRGHAAGAASACSATEKENLAMILDAAKQATAPTGTGQNLPTPLPPDQKPAVVESPAAIPKAPAIVAEPASPKYLKPAIIRQPPEEKPIGKSNGPLTAPDPKVEEKIVDDQPEPAKRPPPPNAQITHPIRDGNLRAYAQMTHDYFLARRCAPNDGRGLGQMYQQILRANADLMRDHKKAEVASALRRSAQAAAKQSCG